MTIRINKGAGYAGHARKCECNACVVKRVTDMIERVHDTSRLVPQFSNQTVPVRAHWRRCPGHLNGMRKTRTLLLSELNEMISNTKGGKR